MQSPVERHYGRLIQYLPDRSSLFNFLRARALANPCPIWLTSQYSSIPTLDIISKVPSDTSILILNGENDSQTPVQQAFLLQQRLTEVNHPDHTLITYPNLEHFFYPSSQWSTGIGPIQQYVLADIYAWLEAHSGFTSPASSSTIMPSSFSNSTSRR
jgi:alpha-beta hydrolase superfamily lysophospholipase